MPANKRHPVERHAKRLEIASLYVRGYTQAEIAQRVGVSQQQVSYDLKVLVEQWRQEATALLDEARARELAKIIQVERECWAAWEASKGEQQITTVAGQTGVGQTHAAIRKQPSYGDPRYLAGIQWAIDRRCKLLGLDQPVQDLERWVRQAAEAEGLDPQAALAEAQRLLRQHQ